MEWNWLTLLVVAFLVLSTLHGTIRGLHRGLVDFVFLWGVVLSFIYGFRYAYNMAADVADDEVIRTLIAGVGLLIISVAVFGIVSELITKSDLNKLLGSRINSALGMIYGFLRGIFILVVVWLAFTSLASQTLVNKTRANLPGDLLDSLATSLWNVLPSALGTRAEEIKQQVVKQAAVKELLE